jgi:predicted MFS family arabinose efflux permease
VAVERDLRLIFAVQALRAFAYGFGSVVLGTALASSGLSSLQVGVVFTAMLGGMAISSVAVGLLGDRGGRRRVYAGLLLLMGVSGAVFATTRNVPLLVVAALTGTLSTDPNESGPITSLEQAMMAGAPRDMRSRVFGRYNAVAYLAGAVGALAAGGTTAIRGTSSAGADQRWLLLFVPVAVVCALLARGLSAETESAEPGGHHRPLGRSRSLVLRLSALFGLDAFAGGFVVQTFLVFWFHRRFGASAETMGAAFFAAGLLQAGSSIVAGRLAVRIGLLNTMVFTHLPSNVLLAIVPIMPSLPLALAVLLLRFALSQMDVPARQAYVVTMVDPAERTAASAFTNTARYVARPLGPLAGGSLMSVAVGLPFAIAGGLKIVYDLALYGTFRRVPEPVVEEPAG